LLSPSCGISSAGPVSTYSLLLWPKRMVSPTLQQQQCRAQRLAWWEW
jgi:hypothetical protein